MTTAWKQEVEQCRSNCRELGIRAKRMDALVSREAGAESDEIYLLRKQSSKPRAMEGGNARSAGAAPSAIPDCLKWQSIIVRNKFGRPTTGPEGASLIAEQFLPPLTN